MDLLCVGHAIKEVLTAGESLAALEKGAILADANVADKFLMSDGGDGLLEAYGAMRPSLSMHISTIGAQGEELQAPLLADEERRTVVIEIAQCFGLRQVEDSRRNIMISSSAGLADLIMAARQLQPRKILIGLGGSATCDGGIGMLWRLAELSGQCRYGCPEIRTALDMADLPSPDINALREWLATIEVIALTDVDNPLLGDSGAAISFAPQKGASSSEVDQLEAFMTEWAERVERNGGGAWKDKPGAGAAGGLGFALAAIGAELLPGAETFGEIIGLNRAILPGMMVLTTEGKFDMTSLGGKAPWSVSMIAADRGAEAVIFCGVADKQATDKAEAAGIAVVEYGRDIPIDQRRSATSQKLAQAVHEHLTARLESTL